jgi:hypothetical protein
MGLPADRPFILYVCSAPFLGSAPEAPFVLEWIRRLRNDSRPALRDVPILVRPHPSRTREWQGVDVSPFGGVAIHGSSPVDSVSRADYFDALYHSAAVVGLNTSAFIEAGIVGRPVHAILLPEWYENQMGTVHFRYLLDVNGGLLIAAHDFDEHLRQLADSVGQRSSNVRPFIRTFVRPHGLGVAATPLFVQAVEDMRGAVPPRTMKVRAATRTIDRTATLAHRALSMLLRLRHRRRAEQWLYSQRELEVMERDRRAQEATLQREAELRARNRAARETKQAERQREWEKHRAMRAAQDAEKKAMRS